MQIGRNKLSVIIPVYNWDVTMLVEALGNEVLSRQLQEDIEILLADDCSEKQYKVNNKEVIAGYSFCKYYEMEKQLGRSRIRNFLIQETKYPNILMLDADMLPDRDNFLSEYRQRITSDTQVICGGYSYKKRVLLDRKYDFYVYKGKKTEEIPVNTRNEMPWRYLFTGNVLVSRKVLGTIQFDEQFVGYGYEDIEWGIRLSSCCQILHIDNTCSHLGLIEKEAALIRMQSSIANFHKLKTLHPDFFYKTGAARMARFCSRIPSSFLKGLDRVLVRLFNLFNINYLSFCIFQLDKAVLLALRLKDDK